MEFKRKDYKTTGIYENEGVVWIEHDKLSRFPKLKHAYSTRIGGVSTGPCASMNLRRCQWDSAENYKKNLEIFCRAAGFNFNTIVATNQTHTINVEVVGVGDVPKGSLFDSHYENVDGLVTNLKGVTLVASFADCIALFFYDPVKQAIGICHSGWKGTVGKISRVVIDKMVSNYGCDPKDIVAAIGPGICGDCYEVGEDLYEAFNAKWDKKAVAYSFTPGREGHYQLDLWKANYTVLTDAGILPENISITDICTRCNPNKLFSHRAQGPKRGNQCGFIAMEKD